MWAGGCARSLLRGRLERRRVHLDDTPEQARYRAEVRAWIEAHRQEAPPPAGFVHAVDPGPYRRWQRKLAEARLIGVAWPREYGGAGRGPLEQAIVSDELRRAGCGGIVDHIAISNIGPTIIAHGSEEQKERYLGPMLRGDEGWCQMFSEPAAGSDLAGIVTRGRPTESGWRLNGQKVWTTMAQHADFGLMLARTDPDVPKHAGLTMFLVPMRAPGVAVRPLRQISGLAHFNEVFLDDVEVDHDAVLGEVDGGWAVAKTTLLLERSGIVSVFDELGWSAESFVQPIADHPDIDDGHIRQRIAEVTCELLALRHSSYRVLTAMARGEAPGPETSLGKIGLVDALRKGCDLVADLLGPDALEEHWLDLCADALGNRTGGGTEEILRTLVGERVLGLPPEPRVDRDVPFRELGNGRARRAVRA